MPLEDIMTEALVSTVELKAQKVEIVDRERSKIFIQVVSPIFEGMDEAERQAIVWSILEERVGLDEMGRLGFVYTDSPSELKTAA